MQTHLYFSYGSNISLERMRKLCPNAVCIGVAHLPDYQLVFTTHLAQRNRGGADVVPKSGGEVWGLLYKISDAELAAMDANKFYPEIYDRILVDVFVREEPTPTQAWTYVMQDKQKSFAQPTNDYVRLLLDAAQANHFPETYRRYLASSMNPEG
jgi:gamma-glutamylcyclotransferase (GGCT)/AIG2-like uncharacterized protein YtfP